MGKKLTRPHLNRKKLGVVVTVVYACDSRHAGGTDRRITVQDWPWAKSARPLPEN
jgi:hypothetical protein